MGDNISDDRIRHLTSDALRLYQGFDEVSRGQIIEAVLRYLPPDFDRKRVERIVSELR